LSSEDNHWKYSSGSDVLTGGLTGPLDSSKGSISCGNSNLSEFCSGPVNPPVRTSEPLEYFQWLSSDDNISIIDILVEETNRYAHQIRNSNNLKPNSRLKKW
jgi:hypothetical protein